MSEALVPPSPLPSGPRQGPRHPGPALTGHVEADDPRCGHFSSRQGHLTGERGAVVLGPWSESEHRGEGCCENVGRDGGPLPGEDGGRAPLTDPGHRAGQIPRVAGHQGPRNEDVRCVVEGW